MLGGKKVGGKMEVGCSGGSVFNGLQLTVQLEECAGGACGVSQCCNLL